MKNNPHAHNNHTNNKIVKENGKWVIQDMLFMEEQNIIGISNYTRAWQQGNSKSIVILFWQQLVHIPGLS